mmetsp:Transcript_20406/g.51814  ORF Transcript_20406/g.51814 Transcript_20406/m.51814 type:complete len:97 (+) Transcript_20406:673-963(+)
MQPRDSVPKCTPGVFLYFCFWLSNSEQVKSTEVSGYNAFGCFLCSSTPKLNFGATPTVVGSEYTGPGEVIGAFNFSCIFEMKTFVDAAALVPVPNE